MASPYRFAFGDEAGDTGLKFDRGSSTHFVPAMVLTNDPEGLRAYVRDFRCGLGLCDPGELSFHPFVKRLAAKRSRSEPALQAADMVAGAVFRYVTRGDERFYKVIQPYTALWKWTGNEKPPG